MLIRPPLQGALSDVMPVQMVPPQGFSRIAAAIPILVLVLVLLPQGAPAHPPSAVQPAFDEGTRVLSVSITHPVADPTTHYIRRVLITAGDVVVSDTAYTSQPSSQSFTYTYPLPPGVKGAIRVTAACSISGSQSASLQVPAGAPPDTPLHGLTTPAATPPSPPGPPPGTRSTLPPATPPATPGAGPGLLPVTAALALGLAGWRLRR